MLTKALSLSALVALATADFTQTIDSVKFITSGPSKSASVEEYELPAYKTATNLLKDRIMEIQGEDGFLQLLDKDIKEADKFWHKVVDESGDKWVSANGSAVAFFPDLTAWDFTAWQSSPLADKANNPANAEHYFKRTVQKEDGHLEAEILEGWGGVTTLFNIPNFKLFNGSNFGDWPFLDPLKGFKYQAAGDKVLADGTRFGVLHIAARDVDGKDYGEPGKKGIEIKAFVWYGDAATDEFLEHERQHMVIEIIRLSMTAQKNIKDGEFRVPPEPTSS